MIWKIVKNVRLLTVVMMFALLGTQCSCLPMTNEDSSVKLNFAGKASRILATNILKENIDIDANHVFSPLGISAVVAILAEAAQDITYNEFVKGLGFPEEKYLLRESFQEILKGLQQSDMKKSPNFKTWFYVYKNNTAKEEFRKILKDYYFVEVKDIERLAGKTESLKTVISPGNNFVNMKPSNLTAASNNSKDILEFEDLKKSQISLDETRKNVDVVATDGSDVVLKKEESELAKQPIISVVMENSSKDSDIEISGPLNADSYGTEIKDKESSKFDRVVDDKQYVEIPIIKKEIFDAMKQQQQQNNVEPEQKDTAEPLKIDEQKIEMLAAASALLPSEEKVNELADEENETIRDEEKIEVFKKDLTAAGLGKPVKYVETDEPEKITIPLLKLDAEEEIFKAIQAHMLNKRNTGARNLFFEDDVASSLSANSLVAKPEIVGGIKESVSQMLLFNGLYYAGSWAYPFQELRESDVFFIGKDQNMPVTMMRTTGTFRYAELDGLKAKVLELPYENPQYSFIAILPDERDGLRDLVEKITADDLKTISTRLADSLLNISLPKFCSASTSHAERALKTLGIKSIFTEQADLSGITDERKLHVEDIVQHVHVRFDEGRSSTNFLTGTIAARSKSSTPEKTITFDRPFLYLIQDNDNDFIFIAGKVVAPEMEMPFPK